MRIRKTTQLRAFLDEVGWSGQATGEDGRLLDHVAIHKAGTKFQLILRRVTGGVVNLGKLLFVRDEFSDVDDLYAAARALAASTEAVTGQKYGLAELGAGFARKYGIPQAERLQVVEPGNTPEYRAFLARLPVPEVRAIAKTLGVAGGYHKGTRARVMIDDIIAFHARAANATAVEAVEVEGVTETEPAAEVETVTEPAAEASAEASAEPVAEQPAEAPVVARRRR